MTVYADSPSQAFSQAATLEQQRVQNYLNSIAQNRAAQQQGWQAAAQIEQQRVQNYLNSIAQNRAAQQQGWQAAAQMEATRQAHEQMQQQQIQHALQQRQLQQQFAASLGYNQQDLAERKRHNMASEEKPNASKEALDYQKSLETTRQAELTQQSENIARYMNEMEAIKQLTTQLPTVSAAQKAESEDFWHWPPFSDKSINAKRAAFSSQLADTFPQDVLQAANFTDAKGPVDYRKAIADALEARLTSLKSIIPANEEHLNALVTRRNGKWEPNFRLNPLLPAPQPSLPTAKNSATGQRVVHKDGAWQPL